MTSFRKKGHRAELWEKGMRGRSVGSEHGHG